MLVNFVKLMYFQTVYPSRFDILLLFTMMRACTCVCVHVSR